MPSTCRVSFEVGAGVTYTISVAASSLYGAAALAVAEFKRCGFAMATVGPATRLKVAVEVPATVHELHVSRLQAWFLIVPLISLTLIAILWVIVAVKQRNNR